MHLCIYACISRLHTPFMFQFYILICFVLFLFNFFVDHFQAIVQKNSLDNFMIPCSVDGSCPSALERDSNMPVSTSV